MPPKQPRLRILAVGGNPVSAFLSWRLQATNACDVTVVWKNGFEHVSQYGLSFKSLTFGNERFKPRRVVRSCEEAAQNREGPFDYVVVCVKALPDVYDLTSIVESVITPQHTCIVVNTTNNLGVEAPLEERFPTNIVLSLVSGAELSQLGPSEFEHQGSAEVWLGPAAQNGAKPSLVREDMAQALAMTLNTGQIECKVSPNIRQQQFERVMGPVTFQPISVLFETANHAQLLEKVGVKELVSDVLDELLSLAERCSCKFDADFKTKLIEENSKPNAPETAMWQDFVARRPMEVEVFLGSPIKLAKDLGVSVPRIETLYTILHHVNTSNRSRPKMLEPNMNMPKPPGSPSHMPRAASQSSHRPTLSGMPMPPPNGMGPPRQPRPRNSSNFSQAGPMRRGPPPGMNGGPPMNGYRGPPPPHMNGGSRAPSRRGSMDANDLEEFSHLVLYDDIPEGSESAYGGDSDASLRERELQMRQRELAFKEQDMRTRRGPPSSYGGPRRGPHPMRNSQQVFDDEDDDDYFDPNVPTGGPTIDPDSFDMMSVTSRKNRKAPGPPHGQMRRHPDMEGPPSARGGRFRPNLGRNRSSQMGAIPNVNDNILDDPLMSCSSNRYGAVDRGNMAASSRTNSLTSARLDEMQYGAPPPMNGAYGRRVSQSPGNPYGPPMRGANGRPSPPNGYGPPMNGRPSPPDGMRQPMARYPHDQGHGVPHHVEQQVGVSSLHPPKTRNERSLTGSASASAGSGELDSERSAHSSQSSFQQRPPVGHD